MNNKDELYPIKFCPIFKYRMWGGEKLKNVLNKQYTEMNIGESWEISDIKESQTVVANGKFKGFTIKQLSKKYKERLLGKEVYDKFKEEFPLLIKFIDAREPLSIQVHPNNLLAKERHNSFGKNEMWYIMQADDDANIIIGFNKEVDQNTYSNHLRNNSLLEILNKEKVKKGDTFYIPTGKIHAIGSGVLLAEIQQTSDITYRIYDYNRIDSKLGKKRELHTELALDAMDYTFQKKHKTNYNILNNTHSPLVHSPYFKSHILRINKELVLDLSDIDSFVIYICVGGKLKLEYNKIEYDLKTGETILLPATINKVKITSKKVVLIQVTL
ncbi:type I phosphomannose isomerase catalytic subunit [Aquimarina latercula]|uniref:type I phosphomannose isomerase catalytic subunit n=1 Tax=Aquimarina latercula TaxID=987 RepID=UPI000419EF89|nr:type I phosphomannose isomerase catalytic subunit [Aquimarina latercula]